MEDLFSSLPSIIGVRAVASCSHKKGAGIHETFKSGLVCSSEKTDGATKPFMANREYTMIFGGLDTG